MHNSLNVMQILSTSMHTVFHKLTCMEQISFSVYVYDMVRLRLNKLTRQQANFVQAIPMKLACMYAASLTA